MFDLRKRRLDNDIICNVLKLINAKKRTNAVDIRSGQNPRFMIGYKDGRNKNKRKQKVSGLR